MPKTPDPEAVPKRVEDFPVRFANPKVYSPMAMSRVAARSEMNMKAILLAFTSLLATSVLAQTIIVHVDRPLHPISPTFFGMMTEEINHAYDGGLYAELLQNRTLQDDDKPTHWSFIGPEGSGSVDLDTTHPVPDTAYSRCLKVRNGGVANEGYWGMAVLPKTTYHGSFYAMAGPGFSGSLSVSLTSADGTQTWATAQIGGIKNGWKRFDFTLKTANIAASQANRFAITPTEKGGSFFIAGATLFPPTYKNRANGNRSDLMAKMADLNPSFLRLPGGNYLEGNNLASRYNFKDTIGPLSGRKGHPGTWGYRSSDGLGFLEFLEWCEDLKCQPVLAVFAGYALNGEHVAAGPGLQPYVQDALDEIEYVTGDTHTKWGAIRAANGHPKPFRLTYVEVGNEDAFDRSGSYDGRYTQFYDAIKTKYPKLQIIATAPVKTRRPDVLDDHYYSPAREMAKLAKKYDSYDRSGPKIFVGEWASLEGGPTPDHKSALGDAAFLTGLERNSDHVVMESYAPLFTNMNRGAAQWNTNLIGYDALNSFGSPSYWVQSMFGKNTGDTVLTTDVLTPTQTAVPFTGGIGVGSNETQVEYKDVTVTDGIRFIPLADVSKWQKRGDWTIDGSHLTSGLGRNDRATTGDLSWADYTLQAKARRVSGKEGFVVVFHSIDGRNFWQWNIGAVGNTESVVQRQEVWDFRAVAPSTKLKLEDDRWYDIKVELKGESIRCFLDGSLVHEIHLDPDPIDAVYSSATLVKSTGEIILKLVNFSDKPTQLPARIVGSSAGSFRSTGWVMSGALGDQNNLQEPTKVIPRELPARMFKSGDRIDLPPYSIVVVRLKPA